MFTENEVRIIRFLVTAIGTPYSISRIARACKVSPNGAYKILKKFESENIVKAENIANIKAYMINYEGQKTEYIIPLVFIPKLERNIYQRKEDLKPLKEVSQIGILFGSYIKKTLTSQKT
ncbi:hypothetical protein CL622_05010 [archaeon]|nr:hypothetical protein [archaeon]|tara:strand:+ start:784 stop:1143 length:360 start_codon:yes stop_codon:yes gene_type:complete